MKLSIWVVHCRNEPQMEWFDCKKDAEEFADSANESGHGACDPLPILIPNIGPNEIGDILESLEYARDASDTNARLSASEEESRFLRKMSMQAERAVNHVRAYRNDMWLRGEKDTTLAKEPR